jgi:alpha-mannosidase
MLTVHVVSHTHWDREWYHPAERFRQRLVALVDELIDDPPPPGRSFLLDGQAVILEDYLEVRPERASELAALLRDGRLEAGPWYVLADELIPGGEALVRNLLAGQRVLRGLRADSPPMLYCPDSFGHPASLPDLASGFQKPVILLWRGFGGSRWPRSNVARWLAPSGTAAVLYHLTRSGYELGSSLPAQREAARVRWAQIRAEYAERQANGPELLLNGADHHARQAKLGDALAILAEVSAPDAIIRPGSLADFAANVRQRDVARLPEVRGELRDSYGYTWSLQGTFGTRAPQKRRYVLRERDLVRDVEPWVALAALQSGTSRRHLVRAAWKPLLLCQPHDTLCGCSIDEVARAMEARLESAATQAEGLRQDAIFDLVGHDQEIARARPDSWQPAVLIRNRAPRSRSGVALAEVSVKLRDEPVGPGSSPRAREERPPDLPFADAVLAHERTEAPRAYPDNDAVLRFPVAFWAENVPGYGVTSIPLADAANTLLPPEADRVRVRGRRMSNGRLTLRWTRRGRVALEHAATERTIEDLIGWESSWDNGDLYTPSIGGQKLRARLLDTQVLHDGPIMGALEQRWRLQARGEHVDIQLRYVLDAGADFLRFGVLGDNAARDHRLRLVVRTDVTRGRTFADAAFTCVERSPLRVSAREKRIEQPLSTAPLHRYVSLFGAKRGVTLFSDGCTEYETRGAAMHVTLVRAVGQLSRNNLPERPGHAGWPSHTPEAQCIGLFQAEFGLLLHGGRTTAVIDEIERAADDVLFPLTGETLRSAMRAPEQADGVVLRGAGLAFSALKETEDGNGLVLRCVNRLDQVVDGEWSVDSSKRLGEAHKARLDETPFERLDLARNSVRFRAGPHEIVTIVVR